MSPASLLRRLGAILYDSLLVIALLFLATIPFIALRGGEPVGADGKLLYQATLLAVVYGFFVGFWRHAGRTLGMQSWGLQLESLAGGRPGIGALTVRFLVAIVSWLALGLGFLWQLWDPERRTWHDLASGTRLVHYPRPPQR